MELESTAYPGTTFKKAYFDIYYINDEHPNNPVVVNGQTYMPGDIVWDNLETDENGCVSTGNTLPVATYKLVEDAGPEGYVTTLGKLRP